ncbi:MAG: serpin family protein, partial [Candidatus Latescibacterota bacterium]
MKTFPGVRCAWFILLMVVLQMSAAAAATDTAKEQMMVAEDNNAFAVELYDELRVAQGNLFFSPFSVSTALAMTYAGARGETAGQMRTALCLTVADDALHGAFGGLIQSLNERGRSGAYQLNVANALWAQSGYRIVPHYLELTGANYGAGVKDVDFSKDPEAARETINLWVEQRTMDKIKELLAQGTVTDQTRLVLTNAIYFKGEWEHEFLEELTETAPFTLISGDDVEAYLM